MKMKASVYLGCDTVELREVAIPKPAAGESLIRVARAGWGFEQMKEGGEVLKVLLDCQTQGRPT